MLADVFHLSTSLSRSASLTRATDGGIFWISHHRRGSFGAGPSLTGSPSIDVESLRQLSHDIIGAFLQLSLNISFRNDLLAFSANSAYDIIGHLRLCSCLELSPPRNRDSVLESAWA